MIHFMLGFFACALLCVVVVFTYTVIQKEKREPKFIVGARIWISVKNDLYCKTSESVSAVAEHMHYLANETKLSDGTYNYILDKGELSWKDKK